MSTAYQVYYKIIVKILHGRSDCQRQKILESYQSFARWAYQNCLLSGSDLDFGVYVQIKEFIEHTCVNLRFVPIA
jgi:hypothetical protein